MSLVGALIARLFPQGSQSTYCHECGERLVGRDWYELSEWNLSDDGHCLHCGSRCAGRPGHWGRKRRPIWMAAENMPLTARPR